MSNQDTIEPDFIEPDSVSYGGLDSTAPAPATSATTAGGEYNPFETTTNPVKRGTLDEPVISTIKRDIFEINARLRQVVYPHFPTRTLISSTEPPNGSTEVTSGDISVHCDLWAPLCFIILYALCVSHAKSLFSSLFVSCWFILLVMALHLKLTKPFDNVSLISYVSLAGYCLFPQVINAALSQLLFPLAFKTIKGAWGIRILTFLKIVCLVLCLMWSLASISLVTKSKGFVQVYPLGLCLLGLGWLSTIL
ncbi:hypothetical protein NCAS_0B05430 [Naumovozyma castellii]|uniref:Protein YIP n=1 Tax=Naumovozyma castellii TaxID=27288 RepID=G0V9L1_NAUCA|nr:hypothetical protein NCAS_0B05430 [Naumovozyma castellii CBS 4309]CCC68627.1 hypothetical protein NCAS_0B05430 [Naumovozyma castellii CBS 4309]